MGKLDDMYGKGASERFADRVPGTPEITETRISKDEVRVDVTWEDGSVCKLSCRRHTIHWLTLRAERKGLYTDMVKRMLEMFEDWGVRTFTASPQSAKASKILRKRGNWKVHSGGALVWHL